MPDSSRMAFRTPCIERAQLLFNHRPRPSRAWGPCRPLTSAPRRSCPPGACGNAGGGKMPKFASCFGQRGRTWRHGWETDLIARKVQSAVNSSRVEYLFFQHSRICSTRGLGGSPPPAPPSALIHAVLFLSSPTSFTVF